jgi:hypothetical protein
MKPSFNYPDGREDGASVPRGMITGIADCARHGSQGPPISALARQEGARANERHQTGPEFPHSSAEPPIQQSHLVEAPQGLAGALLFAVAFS